jgi:hypothetical protein
MVGTHIASGGVDIAFRAKLAFTPINRSRFSSNVICVWRSSSVDPGMYAW